jgi:hypothetical protein
MHIVGRMSFLKEAERSGLEPVVFLAPVVVQFVELFGRGGQGIEF